MQLKVICFLMILLFTTGCTAASRSQMPPMQKLGQAQTTRPMELNRIILVDAKNIVKRGENCSVTIQGRPGIAYTIAASYKIGEKTLTTFESKMAGNDGIVSWVWPVDSDTVTGTYNITITGDDEVFNTTYTVIE